MTGEKARPRVLYIAGAGRSGTTLVACMVGQIPGVFPAGEITHIWDRGFLQNQLCGCGAPFRECRFWREVSEEAFGSFAKLDYTELNELRDYTCSLSRLPQLLRPKLRTKSFQEKLDTYSAYLSELYRAIQKVSGCDWIVDSSKFPPEAFILSSIKDVDLSVVHLVRDSNAVAYAWQKWKVRPEIHWTRAYFPRYPALQTAVAWDVFNLLLSYLGSLGVSYQLIRYEDLVERPRGSIASLCAMIGKGSEELGFIGADYVELGANHTLSGNPVRFRTGKLTLKLDSEWQERVPRLQRALVNLVTLPLQRKYGYR